MKRILVIICLLMVCLCSGCTGEDTAIVANSLLYYVNNTETQVVSEPYEAQGTTKEELIEEYMQALKAAPKNPVYKKAMPDNVEITDYEIGADGQLVIYFNAAYSAMAPVTEVLCRAVIVETFCQIEDIQYVEFYVDGQSLMLTGDTPLGLMQASDFIDNTGEETNYQQTAYITVYFANETGDALLEADLQVKYAGSKTKEQLIMDRLIKGPIEELVGMIDTLPEGTVVNKIATKDGVCYVDLNEKFLNKRAEVTEEATIYAIVNSLAELSNVNKVQITINGETKKVYSSIDISGMLERNLEIIESSN